MSLVANWIMGWYVNIKHDSGISKLFPWSCSEFNKAKFISKGFSNISKTNSMCTWYKLTISLYFLFQAKHIVLQQLIHFPFNLFDKNNLSTWSMEFENCQFEEYHSVVQCPRYLYSNTILLNTFLFHLFSRSILFD